MGELSEVTPTQHRETAAVTGVFSGKQWNTHTHTHTHTHILAAWGFSRSGPRLQKGPPSVEFLQTSSHPYLPRSFQ